jgi:hypothetical protein
MTWQTFFAADDDFGPLVASMLAIPGSQLLEVYGFVGAKARSFTDPAEAVKTLGLGPDHGGHGVAVHCALWVPAVMPPPARRQYDLNTGGTREAIEGCGLFWLQAGGRSEQAVTESTLGWFTEGAARQQCAVEPGPALVDWSAHSQVAKTLTGVLRQLSVARARRFPVLPRALDLHRSGYRLLYGLGIKREATVQAA